MFDLPVMDHCQDDALTHDAAMNEGVMSTRLGLRGWPHAAEDLIVSRNVILSTYSDKPLLVSGAGSDKQNGLVSIAQMFVGGQGQAPQFTYTWAEALRHGADGRR